jgi:hypothetical protein
MKWTGRQRARASHLLVRIGPVLCRVLRQERHRRQSNRRDREK